MSDIKFRDPLSDREHVYTLKRSVFEKECAHLFEKCIHAVERAVEDA